MACFHGNALDDHGGGMVRSPVQFVEWLIKRHSRMTSSFHVVMNISFLLESAEEIRTESLCWARQRYGDGVKEHRRDVGCRYLDLFERRSGNWAIAHRKVVFEWSEDREIDIPQVPSNIAEDTSRRDRSDPIFAFLARN